MQWELHNMLTLYLQIEKRQVSFLSDRIACLENARPFTIQAHPSWKETIVATIIVVRIRIMKEFYYPFVEKRLVRTMYLYMCVFCFVFLFQMALTGTLAVSLGIFYKNREKCMNRKIGFFFKRQSCLLLFEIV